jgi:hypothetical protein
METWGSRAIAPPFLTMELDGDELSASCPGCFTPRKKIPQYPLDRMLCGRQGNSGHYGVEKNVLPLLGIRPQPIACHCADYPGPLLLFLPAYNAYVGFYGCKI